MQQDFECKLADDDLIKAFRKIIADEKYVNGIALEFYEKVAEILIHEIVFQAVTHRQGITEFNNKRETLFSDLCRGLGQPTTCLIQRKKSAGFLRRLLIKFYNKSRKIRIAILIAELYRVAFIL